MCARARDGDVDRLALPHVIGGAGAYPRRCPHVDLVPGRAGPGPQVDVIDVGRGRALDAVGTRGVGSPGGAVPGVHGAGVAAGPGVVLSLIHISEPTRLGMISYAVF